MSWRACEGPARIAPARRDIETAARERGRDPARIGLHFQVWLSFGTNRAEAEAKLVRSQHFRRLVALHPERSEAAVLAQYRDGNLLGSPDEVIAQLRRFEQAGVSHMGIVFLGTSMEELVGDIELFVALFMPAFAG